MEPLDSSRCIPRKKWLATQSDSTNTEERKTYTIQENGVRKQLTLYWTCKDIKKLMSQLIMRCMILIRTLPVHQNPTAYSFHLPARQAHYHMDDWHCLIRVVQLSVVLAAVRDQESLQDYWSLPETTKQHDTHQESWQQLFGHSQLLNTEWMLTSICSTWQLNYGRTKESRIRADEF